MSDARRSAGRKRRNEVGVLWPYETRRQHDEARRDAQTALFAALKSGRLVRQPCEQCGHTDSEGHHDDYSQPLTVRWLCPSCHRSHHYARPITVAPFNRWKRRSLDRARPIIVAITQSLRDDMDRQGITQRELSAMAGVAPPMASKWFSSGFRTLGSLIYAAEALGGTLEIRYTPAPRGRAVEDSDVRSLPVEQLVV